MNYFRMGFITVSGVKMLSSRLYTEAERKEIESTQTFRNANGNIYFEQVVTEREDRQ